jgi:hypothetical protein
MKWTEASNHAQGESRLLQTLVTNTANAWGIAMLPGYDAAIPSRLEGAWGAGQADRLAALRLFGVDYAVLPVRDPRASGDRPRGEPAGFAGGVPSREGMGTLTGFPYQHTGLQPLTDPLPGARLYRVPGSLPRVFLASHAEIVPDSIALARLFEPAVVAGESVWLAPDANARQLLAPSQQAGTCRMDFFSNLRLEAHCDAGQPALAVFNEQYDQGWSATVDGEPAPILRADLNMRALMLAPGTHHIVMQYKPPGLRAGAAVTLASLLALVGLTIAPRRRRRSA